MAFGPSSSSGRRMALGLALVLALALLCTPPTVEARRSTHLSKMQRAHAGHRTQHRHRAGGTTGAAAAAALVAQSNNGTAAAAAAATESPSQAAKQIEQKSAHGDTPSQAVQTVESQIAAGKEAKGESPSEAAAQAAQTVGAAAGNLPPAQANAATNAADTEQAQEQAGAVIAQVMGTTVAPPLTATAENAQEAKQLADELKKPPPLGDPEKDPLGKDENERENNINTEEVTIVHKLDKLRKEALATREEWIKEVAEAKKAHKHPMKAHKRGEWHDYHSAPILAPVTSSSCTFGC